MAPIILFIYLFFIFFFYTIGVILSSLIGIDFISFEFFFFNIRVIVCSLIGIKFTSNEINRGELFRRVVKIFGKRKNAKSLSNETLILNQISCRNSSRNVFSLRLGGYSYLWLYSNVMWRTHRISLLNIKQGIVNISTNFLILQKINFINFRVYLVPQIKQIE